MYNHILSIFSREITLLSLTGWAECVWPDNKILSLHLLDLTLLIYLFYISESSTSENVDFSSQKMDKEDPKRTKGKTLALST